VTLDSFLDLLRQDFRIPIAIGVWLSVTIYHFVSGKDVGGFVWKVWEVQPGRRGASSS
jgi:hypothetical protein